VVELEVGAQKFGLPVGLLDRGRHAEFGALTKTIPLVAAGAVGLNANGAGNGFGFDDEHSPCVDDEVIDLAGGGGSVVLGLIRVDDAEVVQDVYVRVVAELAAEVVGHLIFGGVAGSRALGSEGARVEGFDNHLRGRCWVQVWTHLRVARPRR